ncbi:hypothetical protein HZH66_014570 [Vespula vulgaris]|uniref:Uncharacterized protein n=1 Tax=Vespula vulgaris TaxID=7454 RepID=A0A834J226_VESVU|nr:hypothetical protein HZH66_014570 [Vespula vulgaris]
MGTCRLIEVEKPYYLRPPIDRHTVVVSVMFLRPPLCLIHRFTLPIYEALRCWWKEKRVPTSRDGGGSDGGSDGGSYGGQNEARRATLRTTVRSKAADVGKGREDSGATWHPIDSLDARAWFQITRIESAASECQAHG